ncbi:unnamed protein product [Mytilus edulis]|uniref:Uncharacterized protein n=1 Tax=Mytilus edulis TaxID=6550 RepID=A0A8S3UYA4_MYTED|nr:unnamed protein product [Mytilus edulis]
MANTHRAPKQWCLTKIETVNSFENWRQNIIYTLSLDPHFAPFLGDNVQWEKKTRFGPNRGFLNDGEDVAEANRRHVNKKSAYLPKLVKQRYGTELRSRTLSSIKPEVSQALDSLLEELRNSEDAKVMRAATSNFPTKSKFVHEEKLKLSYPRSIKSCPLCKAAGRPDRHFLSKCSFLPNSDRKYMVKARQIAGILDNSDDELSDVEVDTVSKPMHSVNRVQVRQSPYLDVFHTHYNTRLTIDSGATGNMLRASAAKRMGIEIKSSSQSAHQADGSSPLKVIGEVHTNFTRDGRELHFEGLVVETLDVDILAESVKIDPDNLLSQELKVKFRDTVKNFDDVFDPHFKGYNGAAGPFQARVNMGPVQPPQRKGRVPQYSRNQLVELQQKFDELEAIGVFKRPEDIGVSVEYVNPSFFS